jgi:hypothetical protein
MNILHGNHRSLGISLLVHVALLAVLAIFVIKPAATQRWYEIEFSDPAPSLETILPSEREGAPEQAVGVQPSDPVARATEKRQEAQSPAMPVAVAPAPKPQVSEFIETPAVAIKPREAAKPAVGTNPLSRDILRGIPGSSQSSAGATNVTFGQGGGKVRFSFPGDYKHSLGAPGSVTLRFRVDSFGKPVMSSLEAVEQTGPRYFTEARRILEKYRDRFSFLGNPEPGLECVITINFTVNG